MASAQMSFGHFLKFSVQRSDELGFGKVGFWLLGKWDEEGMGGVLIAHGAILPRSECGSYFLEFLESKTCLGLGAKWV